MTSHASPIPSHASTPHRGDGWPAADDNLAAVLAEGAAEVLRGLRRQVDAGLLSGEDRALRDAGDAAAQRWLAEALAEARPQDRVLSEEAQDDPRRLEADRVWIIDPLDGTREFAERAADGLGWREDFAVHVALWGRSEGLTAGAVALPARNQVRSADAPPTLDTSRHAAILAGRSPLRLAVSRTRPPALVNRMVQAGGVELVPMGSNGVKVMAVLDGVADAYVHAGGQYEWDQAAPVVVATAAGCIATRLDGSPLLFNKPNPWSPDLVVCHPALAAHLRRLIDAAGPDDEPGAAQ